MYDFGDYTVAQIAAKFGVSRLTIYRHLARLIHPGAKTEASEVAK